MSDLAPSPPSGGYSAAVPSPLDTFFPPEKERVDARAERPKHEFEVEDRRYADWRRRRAVVIDCLIMAPVFYAIRAGIHGMLGAGLFTTALAISYFFVMEATTGQTIGKRLMRLRVVMRDGRPATAKACAARNAIRVIDGLPGVWLLGLLSMLLTGGRRQRLGDLAAHTCVRNDDRPMPRAPHSPLLGLYPALWVGLALAVIWQANLGIPHAQVEGRVTSNPYMRKVDGICQRRVDGEAALGADETGYDAGALWARELGAIDSMPPAPPDAREDMRVVRREIHALLLTIGRGESELAGGADPKTMARYERSFQQRLRAMGARFKQLGLPHCAAGTQTKSG